MKGRPKEISFHGGGTGEHCGMRALLLVMDGVGVGHAPDAAAYGDEGANTLGHVIERTGVELPALWSLGLGRAIGGAIGGGESWTRGSWGRMRERSSGKDSTTGHWELAGVVLDRPLATFERFPDMLVGAIERECDVRLIGNKAASGTAIIEELGPEHVRTGSPILYTSADSVLQIAAHEGVVPRERLMGICRVARRHADAWRIGRVIARPFIGEPGRFVRTDGRHDYSMAPPATVLDRLVGAGVRVVGIGKVGDLFAGRGITESRPTRDNAEGLARTTEAWRGLANWHGLVFTNLVDFDTVYGHRRDVEGFARALSELDAWLEGFLKECREEDLLIVTADHGNDPTFRGTDHTREEVPVVVVHGGVSEELGVRTTFADAAATLAGFFGAEPWPVGRVLVGASVAGRR